MRYILEIISNYLVEYGINVKLSKVLSTGLIVILVILSCIIADFIIKRVFLKLLERYIRRNKIKWDNFLLERKVFQKISKIIPAIIIYISASAFDGFQVFIEKIALTYIYIISVIVISSILDVVDDVYRSFPVSRTKPIKGLLQVIKICIYVIIAVIIVSNLLDKDPLILLSGIGALTAITTLVFKDSILGLVAGVQLSGNNMLRIGDWIEMPKYGADGDVIDITLNTVKVQNWDKTIVTLPAYALISDSFKNWRGMHDTGGRRIKRSIYIDTSSIKFCTAEMLEKFKKIQYITDYLKQKEEEIREHNTKNKVNEETLVNGRHLTNIGTFRAYIQHYLKNHPKIHQGLIQMVRQLPPCEHGLPLEIYVFTDGTNWVLYEGVQADIFDHILAVASEFELRVFQSPTGYDIQQITSK